jgi:hypothetical protein
VLVLERYRDPPTLRQTGPSVAIIRGLFFLLCLVTRHRALLYLFC